MASDIRIPDPVNIKKEEDEGSYLINEQRDKIQNEIYKMEEEKLDQLLNQPPGVGDFPFDTIDTELNDEIKTKDNEILVTSHLEQVGNEEKCTSDTCLTSIPKEDETEMTGNEKQFHKCDHTGDAKEKEEYEAVVVDETCEHSKQNIDEQEGLHDIKTSSPVSKAEEDIIVEKEDSSKDEINVDPNVKEILDRQTFVDNNDKPQNIHEERNGSELELKKEASAESTINILNDDIETVTEITNAEDSPCSRGILDEEDVGMKTELKVGDCTDISCDSKVEKATEMSRDTEIEKDEEPSTSNADDAFEVAMPEVQNDEVTMETGISAEAKLEMLSVSEDTDEGSKQEGTREGVNLNGPSDELTNQTETREESTQDNSIPNEGADAEFSEQKLDSINVERQVELQEMTESTSNVSGEVEELTATATSDYIDGSQNTKAVQDLEHKYFKENDPAEETTLVALEENETETPREISETISNEGEKQITNLEEISSGIEKEHVEAAYFGASKDDVPTEEELSPSNLNEVHDGANELSDNNGNDVQLEHSLLQETEKVEDPKVDEVLEFENEQKIQEANNTMTEEEKYVDNVSEANPNTEHTTGEIESLDKTVTNVMISEINSSSVEDEKVSGSGLEEKIKSSEIRVYVPEELESTEDTETSVQRSTIKDNKTEDQIALDDALPTESRNALIEEEIVEKSFEEQDYEEAPLNLSGEDENLSPNEIEKKKKHDEEGSDNIDTENIKEEALVKSKHACFSPETNEVDGSSEKEVEKLREEDSGRSILDEADEKYVGEEVIEHYEDENEDIEISKGEIFCEVENVTGEKFITNEKNEDVETHDKCFNAFKTKEDVAFSEEHDLLAIKEASMEESRNDSTCPTKEVVADNIIDNTTESSEREAMVAEEVAEKVLDEGKSKEEPVNFLVARESETETLSGNDQIISAAEKDIKQIMQKDASGGEPMQPLVIDETETEVLRQNAYNETLEVEDLEETKQTETEACFNSTVVSEKDTEQILQKDETSEEVKQLQFTNEIEEKASCDNAENETSVAREDVEQISHQEETKEELEQLLETKNFESEESCEDTEIIKLEDYTEKDLLNEATKESEASCGDIEITVPKEDAEQVLLKEVANDIVQPQAPNDTETEVFSENVKEILALEELKETKKIETEATSDSTMVAEKYTERSLEKVETSEEVQQLQLTNEIEEKKFCDDAEEISVAREETAQILHQDEPKKELDHFEETQKIESEEHCKDEEVIAPEEDTQPVVLKEVTEELDQSLVINENEMDVLSGSSEIVVNEKDTKQISQNIESMEEFENVPETAETETKDNPFITAKDTENLQKDETREEVKDLLSTSELEAKAICKDDEKETLVAEDDAEKDTKTNSQTHETKEEMVKLINAKETETEVFHGDIETTLAEKHIDQICQKNESIEKIEQYLGIKESNTEGFGDSSGIAIDERNFEETLQKEESREKLKQLQANKDIEIEAEKVCRNTEIDTVMGERSSEEPFEIGESSEKFERSIVTPEPAVKRDVDEDIISCIGGEETAKKEVIETARECHENVILDEINSIQSQSQETISEEITTKNFQNDGNDATGYKELEIEDVSSIEQGNFKENTTPTLSSTTINETITESSQKENSDTVELKQEVIETAGECKENVISDEIDSTKSQSQETVNDEITLEYFQKDETDAVGFKEPETECTSLTEQENFKENTTAILSSMPINETTTESSENENSDALKLKQELQLESKEQIEVENWNELQKDLETKKAINEEIHVEERSGNIAQNLLSESKVHEAETLEGTQEKEDSDSSSVSITERDLPEMGSDHKSAPSEVQKQRDPELHPPPEIDTSTSESNEVANLDKEELADFQNQSEVVDDKSNLQSEELEEVIFENQYEIVDDKNNLELEEAAKDDSKGILQNEKSMEEIEQSMETKKTETEALVAEKDTREGFKETKTGIAEKDTTEVLEHKEPCVVEKDSSASNEMGNMKKEELDFENEYEIVDDKNNLELEGETSKKEEPREQSNEHNATNLNILNDQYSIGDKPTSELNMTRTDFAETSRSIELEEATAAVEVVSQGEGYDDSTVQFNELPTKEVFDTDRTGKETKEETMEDIDTIKINSPEINELDTFEKNFEDYQAKETNLESDIRLELTEALNEETSNQESNESYVASFVPEVSDKEVKEVRKHELIIDDCKQSIASSESENSGLNVAESEEKDMVEDKTVLDSTVIDNKPESEQKDITDVGTMLDFSAEERRDNDIAAVVEGKEGGEYEMEEKLGILTENTSTEEGNENLASTESKMTDQDFEEEISINDYDSPSAKFGYEDLSLKALESKEQEVKIKEDQSIMEIKPEDISILCKEKEEDTTTLVVEGIDNRDHDIEKTTLTKVVVGENILTHSFDFRNDDNFPESIEIPSDKYHLVETKTTEKIEDIVVRDEASYRNFETEEKLNTPAEDTRTKEGDEKLNASIESKVFDEEIKEEIISKKEVSTNDFDSTSTKFESGDLTLKLVESEEQKIQTINDQPAMEIKPENNSILCKEIDDEMTTLAVESMVNQDHDIEEMIPAKVIVEENILPRSFDFTSDSNLQETVEIPSSKNQLIASETPEKVENNIVRDEASYGNFEPGATFPTQTIEEKLDATIEGTCTKEGDENQVASPQSKVPDNEIKEIISKEEISINNYDSPSTKFERKDLNLKLVELEEQELQTKEDQTTIDTKQEYGDVVTLTVESTNIKEHDIEEMTSKEVIVDENILIRSFNSTGDNLQDSAEISSDKHELIATETTKRVESEETEHVMEEVHKAVAEEAFLTASSDTLKDNDCYDSFVVLSEEHLPTTSEMIEEKVSKSGNDDSPDKFEELELSKGKVEISTFVGKENDIIEQEDGYNFKDNTLDLGEEKGAIVFREGDQGQRKEVAEIKENSLLEEKNVKIDDSSELLECATELVNEDQNIQSKMSEAEENIKDIKQKDPTSVEQQILDQSQEDEITSTKMEATVTNEKVCDEIIKTDSRENNEEQVIENKSTLEELHMNSSQGAVNECCEVSKDYLREINSNEKAGTIKSESEEDITSQRETTITETKQEERVMSECMEPPVNTSVSIAEESEEKNTREMRNDLEEMHSPSDEALVETPSASAKAMEADSSFETNAKVAPSLLETQKLMDDPNTTNIPFKISVQASEDEQEVCSDDILSKSKDSEIEEKHQGIAVTSLNTTENEYEKTVEESITTENKVPSEEALEQNKFKEDHYQTLLNEDSKKVDVAEEINESLKSTSEVYYEDVVKLSEVIDEGATAKEKADEHRLLEEVTKKESFTNEDNNEYLKEEETEVNREIQGKTEAITKEKESRVDMLELKGPENSADDNIISKDIYQTKEMAPEISEKKLKQTEEISEEGIKTRSVVGDPIVNFGPVTEPPIENEGQERQDAKEEDREVKEHEHGDSSKDNLCEVRAEESISTDLEKVVSAEHKQSSMEENEPVDRTMAENTKRTIKSEELEDEKIEGAHVGDSGTDEEKGDKHEKDAVSDAPVIVEASKDIDVKVGHKKSHNILSGVGSKVKHSISKVKKAITGKSSHHKSESPK